EAEQRALGTPGGAGGCLRIRSRCVCFGVQPPTLPGVPGRVDRDPLIFGAEEDGAALARREVIVGNVDRNAGVRGERGEHQLRDWKTDVGPDEKRAFFEREAGVAEQRGGIRADLGAEAFAGGAPAERAVEGEIVRVEGVEAAAAFFTGEV